MEMSDRWSTYNGFSCAVGSFYWGISNAVSWLKNMLTNRVPMPTLIDPALAISLLISGLINPIFLVTTAYAELRPFTRITAILKTVVILMIPSGWIVFYHDESRPREGYFVWILGMLLVLLSSDRRIRPAASLEYIHTR
jgi:peptidoglycan biosynthesis protein MviN/MurJ (putative lipid II flippase)